MCEISHDVTAIPCSPKKRLKTQSKRINIFWRECITGCTRWFYCALYFNYNWAVAIYSTSFPNYICKKHFTTSTRKKDLRDFMAGLLWVPPSFLGLWTLPSTVHLKRPRQCLWCSDHLRRSGVSEFVSFMNNFLLLLLYTLWPTNSSNVMVICNFLFTNLFLSFYKNFNHFKKLSYNWHTALY